MKKKMNDFLNFILNRCSVYLLIYFSYMHNALLSTMQIQLKIYIIWLHQFKQNFGTSLLLMFIGLFEWFQFLSNLTDVCKNGRGSINVNEVVPNYSLSLHIFNYCQF